MSKISISIVIVLVSGLVVSSKGMDYLDIQEAKKQFFASADQFVILEMTPDREIKRQIKKRAGVAFKTNRIKAWKAMEGQQFLGWVFEDNVIGKHEFITYAVAVNSDGEVLDVAILSYRETHGSEIRQRHWLQQFEGKKGSDPFIIGKDIDGISGATLSVRNVSDGIKKILVYLELGIKND